MPAFDAARRQKIYPGEARHLTRTLRVTERAEGVWVRREGRELLSFSCNDYLGLAQDARVIAAAEAALKEYGAGAAASRLITGNHPLYEALERAIAEFKGTEAALVFGSGYLANIGAIPALVGHGDLIVADKLVHACMLDGARLSNAKLLRFPHNDLEACEALLRRERIRHTRCLIMTETVFSMDGDRAPLAELAALAKEYGAWLMTDDAHGFGIIPEDEKQAADIRMGTLSKAAGVYGGYVAASREVIDLLVNHARSLIYSTGLPPMVVGAALAAVQIMAQEPQRGEQGLQRARQFAALLNLPEAQSAIVPLILGDAEKALQASQALEREGFLVAAIRPPTVPEGSARLRFAFSALHTADDVARLAACLRRLGLA